MTAYFVIPPFEVFPDVDGQPLEDGFIYIGEAGLNPEVSPIAVYFDKALTTPAAQPLRTIGGFISNSGSPSNVFTNLITCSITVRNKNGTLVYTNLNTTISDITGSFYNVASIDELGNTSFDPTINTVFVESYYDVVYPSVTGPKGGHSRYRTSATGTPGTVSGGFAYDLDGIGWLISFDQVLTPYMFGAYGDDSNDDTSALNTMDVFAASAGRDVLIPAGVYKITAPYTVTAATIGEQGAIIKTYGDIQGVILNATYSRFKNIEITADGTGATSNDGLVMANAARTKIADVYVHDMGNDGISLNTSVSGSNNLAMLENVRSVLNGQHGLNVTGSGVDQNGIVFTNIDLRGNGGDGLSVNADFVANFFNGLTCQNNIGRGLYFNDANARNNIGTVYIEANGTDLEFSASAHTNMIWLSNDGSTILDNNGNNTVLSAGSGATQRYSFSSIDLALARINDIALTGTLDFKQTANNEFTFEKNGSGSVGNLIIAKGSGSRINCDVEGDVKGLRVYSAAVTLSDGAAIIDASTSDTFLTANTGSTNITNITNGQPGQTITICMTDSNTTLVSGTTIRLAGGANFVGSIFDTITLKYTGISSDWYEISRSVNA